MFSPPTTNELPTMTVATAAWEFMHGRSRMAADPRGGGEIIGVWVCLRVVSRLVDITGDHS